jgi:exodeoxyribonuclease VII, large subunit
MNQNEQNVLTITQVNEYIKYLLDSNTLLTSIYLKGEISNFTNHYKTGHLYFTLKDSGGVLKSVMFKGSASKLVFTPENGMKIIAHGRISVYPRDGQYVFYADSLEPDGVGALYIAYEQLKTKLESEGLFRTDTKKQLPKLPTRIGIITSPTGAAIRDMINILGRRFPFAEIILYPALVQGEDAPAQLIDGIQYFNLRKTDPVNVIIIGRGGGSIEDLWAFNNEQLAYVINKSVIPVISAVGHEIDFTICDFVSDKRAPTPSAAAEIAVPDTYELQQKFNNLTTRMETIMLQRIKLNRQNVDRIKNSRALTSPKNLIDDKRMILASMSREFDDKMKYIMYSKRSVFTAYTEKLNALNPLAIISRGYSAVFKNDGTLIKSINDTAVGDEIKIKTTDGNVIAEVKGSEKIGK